MTSIPYKMTCRDYCTVAERNTLSTSKLECLFFSNLNFFEGEVKLYKHQGIQYQGGI